MLPERDEEYLKQKQYAYELVPYPAGQYLILRNVEFPAGYVPALADLMIQIPAGYPNAPLDMFWTSPDLRLANGNWPTACEHHEIHNEVNWQRWSRHIEWRGGIDSLRTFLPAMHKEIAKAI